VQAGTETGFWQADSDASGSLLVGDLFIAHRLQSTSSPSGGMPPLPAKNRKTPFFFVKAPALNVPHLHIPLSICTLPTETCNLQP
jgi:hypothetical protein